ncbi:hypothetical protein [Methylomarinum vadi]|uniref:hypothetical protein n=1 Tax=Methylomarinum vadi TaxID=438855 RepID=UPI00126827BF|nr:hypothetical protein [Methylomarinum vadi]
MKRSIKRRLIHSLVGPVIGLLLPSANSPVAAEDDGRYRAIVLHEGGRSGQSGSFMPKVFIIDSKDGHMWTWEQKAKLADSKGGFALGTVLTYQGRVRPGKKMGEVIDQEPSR